MQDDRFEDMEILTPEQEPTDEFAAEEVPAVQPVAEESLPTAQEQPVEEEPKKKKKGRGVLIAVLAVVLAAVLGVGGWFGITYWRNTGAYDRAVSCVADKAYDQALEQFKSLGSFKDSAQQVQELTRQQIAYDDARELLDQKKLTEAKTAFSDLGDYRDCEAMVQYVDARLAQRNAKKPKEYVAAAELFKALGDVADSRDQVGQCYLKAAYAAVDSGKDPQQYLDMMTDDQKKQFEDSFDDDKVLAGWEEALAVRYEMESDTEEYSWDYSEEMKLLKPLLEYECKEQEIEDLLQEYYDVVQEQKWNLTKEGYVRDWVTQYELELERTRILTQMNEEFDFLEDNEELCDYYVGWEEYFEASIAIEKSLRAWYDELEYQQGNGRTYVEYTKNVPYSFTLYLKFYYYDENGELISTQESGPIPMMGSMSIQYPMNIPKGTCSWDMEYDFSGIQDSMPAEEDS